MISTKKTEDIYRFAGLLCWHGPVLKLFIF